MFVAMTAAAAQPAIVTPGDFRCADCRLTGQQPAPASFDDSQIDFVARPIPAFHENRTVRIRLIARVLHSAPLVLEVLDTTFQTLDRNMRVVAEPGDDRAPEACQGPERIPVVDLASKPVVSALRLNDVVTADTILQRDEKMPDAILAGTAVLTNVRKASAPMGPLRAAASPRRCANRSGILIEYMGSEAGETTIVYNDGSIHHRNAALLTFVRERLSAAELADLLQAFGDANVDSLPTAFPRANWSNPPALTLIGARYQRVVIGGGDARLAPLVKRLDDLARRAMSRSRYIVKRDTPIRLAIRQWPYGDVDLAQLAADRLGRREMDLPNGAGKCRLTFCRDCPRKRTPLIRPPPIRTAS